ncbi:MAG: nitrate ABC transporter substrate-binding protein [Acidobacteriota bacterium]
MRSFERTMLIVAIVVLNCLPVSAAGEIDLKPMTGQQMPAVGALDSTAPERLPLIAWGGDVPTILANGNTSRTAAGSLFDRAGLSFELYREDDFLQQVRDFRAGRTNYLRGTLGMILSAQEALCDDPRTCPQIIYNMTRSTGGDALVVKPGIDNVKGIKGKTIAMQLYGPHLELLVAMLGLEGLEPDDVNLVWYPDLFQVDRSSASPPQAFLKRNDIDAAFVIIPDALALTSGGTVGDGVTDGSVKGAKILFTTETLSNVTYDVYAVRSDYASAHPERIAAVTNALLRANESVRELARRGQGNDFRATFEKSAEILLDTPEAFEDMLGMYREDATFQRWAGNVRFLTSPRGELRNVTTVSREIVEALNQLDLLRGTKVEVQPYRHDWEALKADLGEKFDIEAPRFDAARVTQVAESMSRTGQLDESTLVNFSVSFEPQQMEFPASSYAGEFDRVLDVMSTAGGAIVVIEGNSDPLEYLKQKYGKNKVGAEIWRQTLQAAENLSRQRAEAVKRAVMDHARSRGVRVGFDGVTIVGNGVRKPLNGMCRWQYDGQTVVDPCRPENEQEWAANRRVQFSIVVVKAEAVAFDPDDF